MGGSPRMKTLVSDGSGRNGRSLWLQYHVDGESKKL